VIDNTRDAAVLAAFNSAGLRQSLSVTTTVTIISQSLQEDTEQWNCQSKATHWRQCNAGSSKLPTVTGKHTCHLYMLSEWLKWQLKSAQWRSKQLSRPKWARRGPRHNHFAAGASYLLSMQVCFYSTLASQPALRNTWFSQ